MPASYEPASAAKQIAPWSISVLSQRDLTLRVPINFVTLPGVSLRQACFGRDIFEDNAAVTCFSNLLASGFRRFDWDLYWDQNRRVWSFCPVELPDSVADALATTTQIDFNSSTITISAAVFTDTTELEVENESSTTSTAGLPNGIVRRQDASTARSSEDQSGDSGESLTQTLGGSATAEPSTSAQPSPTLAPDSLIQVGPYTCSRTMDLPILAAVLSDFFADTQTTLDAYFMQLVLHLHAASQSPNSPAQSVNGTSLPQGDELVSALLGANLTSWLYTPTLLQEQRNDLNSSWYAAPREAHPLHGYFDTSADGHTTADGWPNEIFLEFAENYRMVAAFGQVDPQLSNYNLSADGLLIFPPGYTSREASDLTFQTDGQIENGCIYDANDLTMQANNNSWSYGSLDSLPNDQLQPDYNLAITQVRNMTTCGISPFLNTTLLSRTADDSIAPYHQFIRSSSWAWAYSEPRNVSSDEENSSRVRCAIMDRRLSGRWRVTDCTDKHFGACRIRNEPFSWRISSTQAGYTATDDLCDSNSAFDTPRSALENRHLFQALQRDLPDDEDSIWVNFNSLDRGSCWVIGVNTTCPYKETKADDVGRTVVVPVVAAIVVFIVAALTVFVKCAANRQTSKRRRRRKENEGWSYEGIPS